MTADREHAGALPTGPVRGRGAGVNPGNRFEGSTSGGVRLHVLGEHLDAERDSNPDGVQVATHMHDDASRAVINRIDSPDLPFKWTFNPYRGCEHGCVYCYARPTHEYLGLSCGLDFETKIVAKRDAPRVLERELAHKRWSGEPIAISGVTDPYQPMERELRITRGCLEIIAECRQPIGIITKNRMITRDVDLLASLAEHHAVRATISVTTLDANLARSMEPRASAPRDRLRAIRELSDAGVPVAVMVAPVVPGLTEHEIPAILEAAAEAGASAAGWIMLRLPWQVREIFVEWLRRTRPERADRIEHAIRNTRDGSLSDSTFHRRMRGVGTHATQIATTFDVFARRLGLRAGRMPPQSSAFRRPALDGQMTLGF